MGMVHFIAYGSNYIISFISTYGAMNKMISRRLLLYAWVIVTGLLFVARFLNNYFATQVRFILKNSLIFGNGRLTVCKL